MQTADMDYPFQTHIYSTFI